MNSAYQDELRKSVAPATQFMRPDYGGADCPNNGLHGRTQLRTVQMCGRRLWCLANSSCAHSRRSSSQHRLRRTRPSTKRISSGLTN